MILMLNTGLTDVNYTTLLYSILCLLLMAMESFLILSFIFASNCQILSLVFACFSTVLVFILHTTY